jgi:amino acid permease
MCSIRIIIFTSIISITIYVLIIGRLAYLLFGSSSNRNNSNLIENKEKLDS